MSKLSATVVRYPRVINRIGGLPRQQEENKTKPKADGGVVTHSDFHQNFQRIFQNVPEDYQIKLC